MRNNLSRNFAVTSMIAAMGRGAGHVAETLRDGAGPARAVAEALGVERGTPVCALRRVRTADGRRVVDSIDWCRTDVLPLEAMRGLEGGSIYAALAERGLPVHHGVATMTPDVAARRGRRAAGRERRARCC